MLRRLIEFIKNVLELFVIDLIRKLNSSFFIIGNAGLEPTVVRPKI